jgi:hypothetical protein
MKPGTIGSKPDLILGLPVALIAAEISHENFEEGDDLPSIGSARSASQARGLQAASLGPL